MAKDVKPGIPNINDLSQPTAEEVAESEVRKEEARAQRDRIDEARRILAEEESRLAYRDSSLEQARGGSRGATSNDDWERDAMRVDPERRRRMQEIFNDSVLPNLPRRPGMHRCWVSTTHNSDTPQRRMRLGYWFYKHEDAQKENWHADEYAVLDASSIYKGCLMWREMVAMETDEDNVQMILRETGHDRPADQERGIYDQIEGAGEQLRHMGGRTSMAPGMERLRAPVRPPRQFET
jgi:hypothetical protein